MSRNYHQPRNRALPPKVYHLVVLGSGGVGKSCLTAQFVENVFIESYDPTIEDSYRKNMTIDGHQVILEILDTAGTEQFTAMRDLYMRMGEGFLLVFSITSKSSLHELLELRDQIIRIKDDPTVPIVLVGNKADLVDDRAVSRKEAFDLAREWDSTPYFETSARNRSNIDESFVELCRLVMNKNMQAADPDMAFAGPASYNRRRPRSRRRDRCVIL